MIQCILYKNPGSHICLKSWVKFTKWNNLIQWIKFAKSFTLMQWSKVHWMEHHKYELLVWTFLIQNSHLSQMEDDLLTDIEGYLLSDMEDSLLSDKFVFGRLSITRRKHTCRGGRWSESSWTSNLRKFHQMAFHFTSSHLISDDFQI